jgi:hypothetical protein
MGAEANGWVGWLSAGPLFRGNALKWDNRLKAGAGPIAEWRVPAICATKRTFTSAGSNSGSRYSRRVARYL